MRLLSSPQDQGRGRIRPYWELITSLRTTFGPTGVKKAATTLSPTFSSLKAALESPSLVIIPGLLGTRSSRV